VYSITALPEKPQNMHIIKPSPTKAGEFLSLNKRY
jgi:hypothetical protein